MATMALSETLKLYFNLTHYVADEEGLTIGFVIAEEMVVVYVVVVAC